MLAGCGNWVSWAFAPGRALTPTPPAPTLPSLAFPRPPLSRPDIQYLPLPGGWGGGGGTRKVLWSPEIKE